MKQVSIYSDGSCRGNPGPGGWAALLVYVGQDNRRREKELSGYEPQATNNRMELLAAIRGLEAITEPCEVQLYTDSTYVIGVATGNKARMNLDLVAQLRQAVQRHSKVIFSHVSGHTGHPENERVDRLAQRQAEQAARASQPSWESTPAR